MINKKMRVFSAIAIIGVVIMHIGHNLIYEIFTYIPMWRMPAFMFILGYFFKNIYTDNVLLLIKKKIKTLIIPLYVYSLFYGIINTLLINYKIVDFGEKITFYNLIVDSFLHSHQYEFTSAMWFLSTLFLVEILYVLINKLIKENNSLIGILFICLNLLSVFLSNISFKTNDYFCFLLPLLRTGYFLIFYHLGNMYKMFEYKDKFNTIKLLIPFLVNSIVVAFYCGDTQELSKLDVYIFDVSWMNFPNEHIWVPLVISLVGIYFWLHIADVIANATRITDWIYLIGEHTFDIMTHHIFIYWIINTFIFILISNQIVSCINFDYGAYRSSVWYKITDFWPFINLIYTSLAIIGSILIGKVVELCKNKVRMEES